MAVVVALVLRLTWTIAEVAIGLILYAFKPAVPRSAPHDENTMIHSETPTEQTHA